MEWHTCGSSVPPPPRGMRSDQSLASEEGRMLRLAEDLRSESSSHIVLKRLKAFNLALKNQLKADKRACLFIQAGGQPTVSHLLRGNPLSGTTSDATADADSLRSSISYEAANAVNWLVTLSCGMARLLSDDSAIGSLVDALRDAPSDWGRLAGAHGLMLLANANPAKRQAVAQAGVMGVLLQFVIEVGELACNMQMVAPVWSVARVLLREEGIARRDLRQAICGAQADQAFTALYFLNDCLGTSETYLGAALDKDGIVDALVATLNHESPYCVAAAAAGLALLCQSQGSGQALLGSRGAIPALVRVIERGRPRAVAKTGLYERTSLAVRTGGNILQTIGYDNPTAMAVGALCTFLKCGLSSVGILEAGGIAALVQLLKEPTCPQAVTFTAIVITALLDPMDTGPAGVADRFFESGLCQPALQALRVQTREVRREVLSMLSKFIYRLSDQSRPGAVAELVAGDAAELTVGLIAEAGVDISESGFYIFKYFFKDPAALERICGSAVADQLIKWAADLLPDADGPDILLILDILSPLLKLCPCSIPATIEANLVPSLVRALRKFQHPPRGIDGCHFRAIERPLSCLEELLRADMGRTRQLWKAAIKAGVVPVISDLLTRDNEQTRLQLVEVSGLLLAPAPLGKIRSWGVGLLRAISQLLSAAPPAPRVAADMLYNTGLVHPELFVDCRTWGIDDGVRRLTMDSDPDTAAAALKLHNLLFLDEAPDVKGHSAGGEPVDSSASTSTTPPNPNDTQPPGTPSPKRPTRPTPTAASPLDPTPTKSDGCHNTKAGSSASPGRCHDQGKLSDAPVPKSSGECSSHASASPGRCGVHMVRACARCGRKADQIRQPDGEVTKKCKLKECTGCRSVRYCGKACQTADWPAHKATCKRLQAARQ